MLNKCLSGLAVTLIIMLLLAPGTAQAEASITLSFTEDTIIISGSGFTNGTGHIWLDFFADGVMDQMEHLLFSTDVQVDDGDIPPGTELHINCSALDPGTYRIWADIPDGDYYNEAYADFNPVDVFPPVANFYADDNQTYGASPFTVQFWDDSSNAISWAWDFDNNGTVDSTERNPTHIYESAGTYTVRLTVTNNFDSDTEIKADYISVTNQPIADFSAEPSVGYLPLTVHFIDLSSQNTNSWAWDFDNDGTVDSTEQNPTHIYSSLGYYTVKLTATNAFGSDEEIKTDYIHVIPHPPQACFTADVTYGPPPLTVHFTDQSLYADSWAWDFDNDGTVDSTEQNPTHIYNSFGTYTVTLTVTGPGGSDVYFLDNSITVSDLPLATFTADITAGSAPLTVHFTDQSINADSWEWDFDYDGTVDSTEQNPTYTYTSDGSYTVKLTATNSFGSDDEIKSDYISVVPLPLADFCALETETTGPVPLTVHFYDLSLYAQSWAWDFDNNGTIDSTEQNPTYTYNLPGLYDVKLTVTNPAGSDDEIKSGYITVYPPPVADFTADITYGTAPLTVHFTDQSTVNDPQGWEWDFDISDGPSIDSTDQNPTHTYTSTGTYTVSLMIYDQGGADCEIKQSYIHVTLSGSPVWDLNSDHVCNIGDVVKIGLKWGMTGAPGWIAEDLNNDGVINIGDVVVIGLHWGETW